MFSYLCGVRLAVVGRAELGDVEGLAGSTGRLGGASRCRGCPRCAYHRQDEEHPESIVCGSHFSLVPTGSPRRWGWRWVFRKISCEGERRVTFPMYTEWSSSLGYFEAMVEQAFRSCPLVLTGP
jgi:hypothetical protein